MTEYQSNFELLEEYTKWYKDTVIRREVQFSTAHAAVTLFLGERGPIIINSPVTKEYVEGNDAKEDPVQEALKALVRVIKDSTEDLTVDAARAILDYHKGEPVVRVTPGTFS